MKSVRILLGIIMLVLMLTACQKKGIFYWGDYSKTYYGEMKNPCEATSAAHLKSLENIIEQSRTKKLLVPPGVHAEYGFMMLKAGKKDVAIASFGQEKALYPESRLLMDRLISTATAQFDAHNIEDNEYLKVIQDSNSREGAERNTGAGSTATN